VPEDKPYINVCKRKEAGTYNDYNDLSVYLLFPRTLSSIIIAICREKRESPRTSLVKHSESSMIFDHLRFVICVIQYVLMKQSSTQ